MNSWIAGSSVRVANYAVDPVTLAYTTGGFKNAAGVLADPTTVILKLKDPLGAVTTPGTTKDATGLYHYDVDTTGKAGTWTYEWIGTGAVQAINANQFKVSQPPI